MKKDASTETMEIRLEDIRLDGLDLEVRDSDPSAPRSKALPPPLPPSVSAPPVAPVAQTVSEAPKSKGKAVVFAVAFVVLLGLAVLAGLKVAGVGASPPAATTTSTATATATTSTAAAATPTANAAQSASPGVITIPTVEFADPPASSK